MTESAEMPTIEKVETILKNLRSSVEHLLKKHASVTPPYTPDYYSFETDMHALLLPVGNYFDNQFHQGNVTDSTFAAAMTIIAALKWDVEKEWQLNVKKKGQNHSKSIQGYCFFKLLLHWFCYTATGKEKMPSLFDLEYRALKTEDKHKKYQLYSEIEKVYQTSGSACYQKAIALYNEGDLESALSECNEGLKRSPENTHIYSLKSKIYSAMADASISEGLKSEPKDYQLLADRLISRKLIELRTKFLTGDIDSDAFLRTLEKTVSGTYDHDLNEKEKYLSKITNIFSNSMALQEESITLLVTGEFLLDHTPGGFDYAPSAVEFCKALEIELEQHLLLPFKNSGVSQIAKNLTKTNINSGFWEFCVKGKSMTLGGIGFLLQIVTSQTRTNEDELLKMFADHLMLSPRCQSILGACGLRELLKPENVDKYRNGAAHVSVFPKERAEATATWCYAALKCLIENVNSPMDSAQ